MKLGSTRSFFLLALASLADAQEAFYSVDFGNPDSVTQANMDAMTAEILTHPEGFDALRIDECGKQAVLPVNINPSVMPDVTLVIALRLESIPEGSMGWPLSSDNGGYDRSIVLHDPRFSPDGSVGNMGMATGDALPVWNSDELGQPPLDTWLHIVAVFSGTVYDIDPNAPPSFGKLYVNGMSAPITLDGLGNGEGLEYLVVGTNTFESCNHWVDAWIKQVQVFDRALDDAEVRSLTEEFYTNLGISSVFQPDDSIDLPDDPVTDNDGLLDAIFNDSESEDEESEDSNLFEDLLDTIMGSSSSDSSDDSSSARTTYGMSVAIVLAGSLFMA